MRPLAAVLLLTMASAVDWDLANVCAIHRDPPRGNLGCVGGVGCVKMWIVGEHDARNARDVCGNWRMGLHEALHVAL